MKTLNITMGVAAVLLFSAIAVAQDYEFQKSSNYQKLDGRARQAWTDAMRAGDKKRELKCLVKVSERLDQAQKNKLATSGFKAGTIIQTIVTGSVTANDVPKLAALDFVKVVELAVPLSIKQDPGYKAYGAPAAAKKPAAAVPAATGTKSAKAPDTASTPKAAAQTSIVREEARETSVVVEPVQQGQVIKQVPIYETPAAEPTYPNRPPTSPETPSEEPAIAPVDQAPTPVDEKPTLTQPLVQPAKNAPAASPATQPAAAPMQQAPVQ